jgi:hypothetical protein
MHGSMGSWLQIAKRAMEVSKQPFDVMSASIEITLQRRGSSAVLCQRALIEQASPQRCLSSFVLTSSGSWFATSQ